MYNSNEVVSLLIKLSDFPAIDTNKYLYDICDSVFVQLFKFYCKNNPNLNYVLQVGEVDSVHEYLHEDHSRYNDFGIFISNEVSTCVRNSSVIIVPEGIIDLEGDDNTNKQSLQEFLQSCYDSYDQSLKPLIFFNFNCKECSESLRVVLVSTVHDVFPECVFGNSSLTVITNTLCDSASENNSVLSNWDVIDLTSLLSKFSFNGVSYNKNLSSLKEFCKEVDSIEVTADSCFTISPGVPLVDGIVYATVAAYLSMAKQKKFYVPKRLEHYFQLTLRNLVSQEYNYVSDYLKMISEPLQIGVHLNGSKGSLCVLDNKKIGGSRITVSVRISQMAFDLDNCSIESSIVEEHDYDFSLLEPISIASVFQINTGDFNKDLENLTKLNNIITLFERFLIKKYGELHRVLNCSNVMLYRFQGKVFIGYVVAIDGVIPYKVIPLGGKYTPFNYEFSLHEYKQVYDTSRFPDGNQFLNLLKRQGISVTGKIHQRLPACSIGVLMTSIKNTTVSPSQDSNFSVEEIGLWSLQTSEMRKGSDKILTDYFTMKSLRNNNVLGFYGGLHPSVSCTLRIMPDAWK